ncbi:hypothetical protein BUALT_Bualt16G0119600 [Buddleja alternifolia]|uniref:HTH three-helical bundle domain-containing protein n=1 Tax=Buddleja alternifolia TaxID=168488 RepID=A0AAV6WLN2_9LAMI|nr:hypothetical protein BUALT_Bualt16G0119600 [Buddleja alternifolia]
MVATTVEASFPSELERSVASALLLLASSSPKRESNNSISPESFESFKISDAKSSGGSSTAETSVDEESSRSRAQQLTVVAFVPRFHELKLTISALKYELQIVRKKRSKSIWISNGKKMKSSKPEPSAPASSENASEITTVENSSCLSSGSSVQSCSNETNAVHNLRKSFISGHMGHRAAAILRILSNGSASEVRIRQLLGDSPSTSKALRMLLKQEEVMRFGAGGRADPFIYMKILLTYSVVILKKFHSIISYTYTSLPSSVPSQKDPNVRTVYSLCSNYYGAALDALEGASEKLQAGRYGDLNGAASTISQDVSSCQNAFSFAPSQQIAIASDNKKFDLLSNVFAVVSRILSGSV